MNNEALLAIGAAFTGPVPGGVTGLIAAMHGLGATTIGRYVPRVPIQAAIDTPDLFGYLGTAWFGSDSGWKAMVSIAPYTAINIVWPRSAAGEFTMLGELYDRVITLGEVDYAACDEIVDPNPGKFSPRTALLRHFVGERYAELGPATLGARTLLGPRLLALLEPGVRDVLMAAGHVTEHGLAIGSGNWLTSDAGREQRRVLSAVFEASAAVMRRRFDADGIGRATAGPTWVPLPPGPPPPELPRKSTAAIKKLRSGQRDLELVGLIAPFAELDQIDVLDIDLGNAKLPLSSLKGAIVQDVGAYGADLRGCDAQNSQWLESTLEGADLRWADFTKARFPITSLDHANAANAVFTDAELIETAESACFDHATALRWKPDAPEFPASMTGATFRHAVLREAQFAGTKLEGAVFDGADLTGASFTGANLRGASFRGAMLTGTTFTGCDLDGAVFDPGHG